MINIPIDIPLLAAAQFILRYSGYGNPIIMKFPAGVKERTLSTGAFAFCVSF
jgi:hypothetical protein